MCVCVITREQPARFSDVCDVYVLLLCLIDMRVCVMCDVYGV